MFFAIVFIALAFIAFLAFRDWLKYQRLNSKDKQKLLLYISKLISSDDWVEAKKQLEPHLNNEICSKELKLLHLQVLRGTHSYARALQYAIEYSHAEPEELLYRVEEGKILLEMGHASEALECFRLASPILRKESDLLDFAAAHLKSGDAESCWNILEPLLLNAPHGNALALAGEALLELKRYPDAISYFERAIAKGARIHQMQTLIGQAQRLMGDLNESERTFRKILEKDGACTQAILGLGLCMEERGFFQKALTIYRASKAWEKRDVRLLSQAAKCALYTHRFNEAEEYFLEIMQSQGPTSELLSRYGYALEMQEKWQEAEENYLMALSLFPKDPKPLRALGWMFGAGLTCRLQPHEGVEIAGHGVSLLPDPISYEILSAAVARVGNFETAYQIQEYLSTLDTEKAQKVRRGHLLKALRKQLPLDAGHMIREQVA